MTLKLIEAILVFMCSCPKFSLWININPYHKLIVTHVLLSILIHKIKGNAPTPTIELHFFSLYFLYL